MGSSIRAHGQLAAILALGAAVRGWLLARPIAALDGRSLPDDAYIVMEIARNIGWGHGPRFVDYLTNGFQPLFVWLAAIPFSWTTPGALDPSQLDFLLKLALGISCTFDLGSLLLLSAAVHRGTGSRAAGLFAALLWALQPAVLRVAVNGLETATAIFFLLWVWNLMLRRPFAESTPARLFGVGLVSGVAAMARIDFVFVGFYFAIESIRALRVTLRAPQGHSQWIAQNVALAVGCVAGYAPWMLYSWQHTGTIIPGSGRAVRWITLTHANHVLDTPLFVGMLSDGLAAVNANLPVLGKAAAIIAASAFVHAIWRRLGSSGPPGQDPQTRSGTEWLRLPIVFGTSLFCAYTLYVFGRWFFPRYLAPIHVLAIATVAAGVASLARRAGQRARLVWLVAAFGAVLATTLQPSFHSLLFHPPDNQAGYRNLGIWARHMFSPGTVIGATQTGALAYYAAGYRVVNLDGVVNPRAYREVIAGRALDYIRDENIDYVVAWRRNYEYLKRNSRGFVETDLPPVGYIEEFRSWGIQWQVHRVGYPDGRVPPPIVGRP
ncbi:MAG: hypothetical protein AAEJ52_02195 [Myxococcota bacterium]